MQRSALWAARRGASPDEQGGELNVVPFLDIIMNVLMFVLATVAITFSATIDTRPPSTKPGHDPKPLNLSILISDDGMSVKTRDGTIAELPRDDYAGLQRCVAGLKSSADFADETSVTLSASSGVRYESVIATMDAVRTTDDGKDLFPDVAFGVVR
jgi:biopolymer transport protein TolR